MQAQSRTTLMQFHMLLAAFVFPAALMFLITGGFYTWGVKGSYVSEDFMIPLPESLNNDKTALQQLVRAQLESKNVPVPSGKAKVKTAGTSYLFEWTGADHDVILQPTTNPREAKLTVKDTSWYRTLVQLHKAKGGQLFKIYAAFFACALLLILSSGFIMALQIPKFRGPTLISAVVGAAVFLSAVMFS